MSDINDKIKELSERVAGQMDAHLIESIISLFNRGVLVHYVRTPRTDFNTENLTLSVDAASGVRFEGRERIIELEQQLKDAEKVILTCDTIFKSSIDKQKAINEYIEKYNIPKGV